MGFEIEKGPTDLYARVVIDSAVHDAITRLGAELGDKTELVYLIATVAAKNALDQFRTLCNSELRLIEADYERRASLQSQRILLAALNQTEETK